MKKNFRLGTRGSPLALIQAETVLAALHKAHPELKQEYDIELVPIRTGGDWRPEMGEQGLFSKGGYKDLFTKEIEEVLLAGQIDAAVHSMKDVATASSEQTSIAAMLERADPRDAFMSNKAKHIRDLPTGATIGTSSPRRQAQILAMRPDIKVVPLRGNVETRLKKLDEGMVDATILAVAGLQRLSLINKAAAVLDFETMLPAAAQGAIGIAIRRGDKLAESLVSPLNHTPTSLCVQAERAFLAMLDGSCQTPIGALARLASDQLLVLEGLVVRPDGSGLLRLQQSGNTNEAEAIGTALGQEFKRRLPDNFFAAA